MKSISILMTSYNLTDYIDISINSVVSQRMPCDWELLIGDDGSTDGTVDKIAKWVQKYPNNIKLYGCEDGEEQHKLLGSRAASNRARLLEKATGDYFIFLDGDDCWLETEKLATQFAILENPQNSKCSCCGHDIEWFDVDVKTTRPTTRYSSFERVYSSTEYWHNRMYLHTNTILFRASCQEGLLNSLNRVFLNDTFITFCLLQNGSMYYIPKIWARYNWTGKGLFTGSSEAYRDVRNLVYSEKRNSINPNMEKTDIVMLFALWALKSYDGITDKEKVIGLLDGLDPETFKYSYFISRRGNWNVRDFLKLTRIYLFNYREKIFRKIKQRVIGIIEK